MTATASRGIRLLSPARPLLTGCLQALSVSEVNAVLTGSESAASGTGGAGRPGATSVALVVVAVSGDRRRSTRRLLLGSTMARCAGVPLVVVETSPAQLDLLQRGFFTRRATRAVTRCVSTHLNGDEALGPELVTAIGLTADQPGRNGVAPLSLADLGGVVRVHRAAFPDSAVTLLGPRVVDRYYRWQFIGTHPSPFAAGYRRDGELVGFVFGGLRHQAVTGYARRFLPVIVLGAVTHPRGMRALVGPKLVSVMGLMARQRRRGRQAEPAVEQHRPASPSPDTAPSFGILSIAVSPGERGSGAATHLMVAAESEAVARGFGRVHLTVSPDNHRAIRFYERLGWERAEDGNGWTGRMVKSLSTGSTTS